MKQVLIAVVGLLAIGIQAQDNCPTPVYTENIVPVCQANTRIKLPNYADPTTYYSCSTGSSTAKPTPVLLKCEPPRSYFSYVLQECSTCANYIPAVECSQNKLGLKCEKINSGGTTAPSGSTAAPTSKTTGGTTVKTTKPGTTKPTTANPGPTAPTLPGDTTAAPGQTTLPGGDLPTGTTIFVPQPPSPNDPNVPAPPTPEPTVGTLVPEPPYVE
ncbi:hypothetical protein AWZ03_008966 [Drosophila navojoa]|uniref:Chitin-binding type-2 domain-containing protein n=1 Tax=Drosophila navojoa TaxID=7232 RepID=A0A484BA70_DRONA|nr:peritrophin-55 [Drosophila navojoa]TDG44645.1 hypothetical protein AWZ03_008966 [Drosophila navojoa]